MGSELESPLKEVRILKIPGDQPRDRLGVQRPEALAKAEHM